MCASEVKQHTEFADDVLLEICGTSREAPHVTEAWLADLRRVEYVARNVKGPYRSDLEYAITLLALVLGHVPQHRRMSSPAEDNGPATDTRCWIDKETLEQTGMQIIGTVWPSVQPFHVATEVRMATSTALRFGLLEEEPYDAWHPGMASGSGMGACVRATPYGVSRARQQAQALSSKLAGAASHKEASATPPGSATGAGAPDDSEAPSARDYQDAVAPLSEDSRRGETATAGTPQENGGPGWNAPIVDEDQMAVTFRGIECKFSSRGDQLFLLLARLLKRPGRRVGFDTLQDVNDVWRGNHVEDSTIRGAICRLRGHLRQHNLGDLAAALRTMVVQGGACALYDPDAPARQHATPRKTTARKAKTSRRS